MLIGVQIVFRNALSQAHFLQVQILFDAPQNVVVDDAGLAQLEHDLPFGFDQLRLDVKAMRSMLHRAVVISVQMRAELGVAVTVLILQAIQKGCPARSV